MRRILKKVIWILFVIIILWIVYFLGCAHRLNKFYNYERVEKQYTWGTVSAKFLGTDINQKNLTVRGNPYELLIGIHSKKEGTVTLLGARLHNLEKDKIIFENNETQKSQLEYRSYDGMYRSYFSFKDLNLEYVRYKLILKFQITIEETTIEEEVELIFEKAYEEFRSNDTIDQMMSV